MYSIKAYSSQIFVLKKGPKCKGEGSLVRTGNCEAEMTSA